VNQTLWARHRLRNGVTRSLNTQPRHEAAESVGMSVEDRSAPLGPLINRPVFSITRRISRLSTSLPSLYQCLALLRMSGLSLPSISTAQGPNPYVPRLVCGRTHSCGYLSIR
jgi:hypothetical protein